ncbi:ribonuclease III [Ostreibacterium oceani]|uniref:Ribonuclease 3 n=1 Tax=Ostreibacterium oceani TaxID=2654998 RepID=A0A6N7EYT0_9GAMM|nr:ribonuclease III [Ostreibacterium oceani]MPV85638.1 ribonuclease III [Ostreibacterium oceani]
MVDNEKADLARLENTLGYTFTNRDLLVQALTHRSKSQHNNERLEFLGDALLETILSDLLFSLRPEANEGDLTRLRANMVRGVTLAKIADDLQLKHYIRVGSGELRTGGYQRDSTLADAVEAIVAAIYLDNNSFDATYAIVEAMYQKYLRELPDASVLKDAKTQLQEYLQSRGEGRPEYELLSISGPDHDKQFVVCCRVGTHESTATASSKKKAEQKAAKTTLALLHEFGM